MIAGIKSLLAIYTDVAVQSIGSIMDGELVKTIKKFHPDVLILDEGLRIIPRTLLQKLFITPLNLQVFVVNQEDNVMRIYQGKWFKVALAKDLGKLINGQSPFLV